MEEWQLKTPVALFIFNRPDTTAQVFAEIAKAKPPKLLVVADGPRTDVPGEREKCSAARAIIDQIDWPCALLTNYSAVNLGCKHRVSSGLDWVFTMVEEAIILEDDCLPHPTFFRFCDELLVKYCADERVMHIGGTNLLPQKNLDHSFLFSRLVPIWGWATWRRAWQHYDIEMKRWPEYKKTTDLDYFGSQKIKVYDTFEQNFHQRIKSWDGQWAFSCLVNKGLSIIPRVNLVRNLGFRKDATHTTRPNRVTLVPITEMIFPLDSPSSMQTSKDFDHRYLVFLSHVPLVERLKATLARIISFRRNRSGQST